MRIIFMCGISKQTKTIQHSKRIHFCGRAAVGNARLKTVLCQRALFCQGWSFVRKGSPFSWSFIRSGGLLSRKLVLSQGLCPGRWSLSRKMAFVKEGGLCQSWSLSGKVVLVRMTLCQGGWSLVKDGLSSGTVILSNSP